MHEPERHEWARPASDAAAQRLREQRGNAAYILINPAAEPTEDWPLLRAPGPEIPDTTPASSDAAGLRAFALNHLRGTALVYGIVVSALTITFMLSLTAGQHGAGSAGTNPTLSAAAATAEQRQLVASRARFFEAKMASQFAAESHIAEVEAQAQPNPDGCPCSTAQLLDEYALYNPTVDGARAPSLDQLLAEYEQYNPEVNGTHAPSLEQLLAEYEQYNPTVD